MRHFISVWNGTSLTERIIIGAILGLILGVASPKLSGIDILEDLLVGGLKTVAPSLVFVLVVNTLSQYEKGQKTNMSTVVDLYLARALAAALIAVSANYIFPLKLTLGNVIESDLPAPEEVAEAFRDLLFKIVDSPVNAIISANYIGVLARAVIFGLAMCNVNQQTKDLLQTMAKVTPQVVRQIINLAPFGILGLVFNTISDNGIGILANYGFLTVTLVGTMLFAALMANLLIAFVMIRQNPYLLVLRCSKESGLTAFFMRSSAANIPVNAKLCEDSGLSKDTYLVSIPPGATANMTDAAITINVLTLTAVDTLGINVDFPTAFLLSVISAASACGASGVAGGSLLLIPVACSLFGISNDIAMQVVGVGFIVGAVQDFYEIAPNSSTDVFSITVAEESVWGKNRKARHN